MDIREITVEDHANVRDLILEAFENSPHGYQGEADLVEAIRKDPTYTSKLELVVVKEENIVGHGLLSEVRCVHERGETLGLSLAPIEVATSYQGKKIGSQLMDALEKVAKTHQYSFIAILGDPAYYERFGYHLASEVGVKFPFDVPETYCLIKLLTPENTRNLTGKLVYLSVFE